MLWRKTLPSQCLIRSCQEHPNLSSRYPFKRRDFAVRVGDREALFTHLAAPVMTRLRQPERRVLDTLVDAGVARSRAEALAWCVRLVGERSDTWLAELRTAMEHVEEVRKKGPAA